MGSGPVLVLPALTPGQAVASLSLGSLCTPPRPAGQDCRLKRMLARPDAQWLVAGAQRVLAEEAGKSGGCAQGKDVPVEGGKLGGPCCQEGVRACARM